MKKKIEKMMFLSFLKNPNNKLISKLYESIPRRIDLVIEGLGQ